MRTFGRMVHTKNEENTPLIDWASKKAQAKAEEKIKQALALDKQANVSYYRSQNYLTSKIHATLIWAICSQYERYCFSQFFLSFSLFFPFFFSFFLSSLFIYFCLSHLSFLSFFLSFFLCYRFAGEALVEGSMKEKFTEVSGVSVPCFSPGGDGISLFKDSVFKTHTEE